MIETDRDIISDRFRNNDKYYELLENIIQRLKKNEKNIYNNDNVSTKRVYI